MFNAEILKDLEKQAEGLDFSKLNNLKPVPKLQNTDEWLAQRRFKLTSSCIHKLVTQPKAKEAREKGELSETAKAYIMQKVAEELGGQLNEFHNDYTDYGTETEPLAVEAYRLETGNKIESVGFCQYSDFYGGSPDRAAIDFSLKENIRGGVEVKCPYYTENHLWHCLIDSPKYFKANHPDYYWQCKSHMITMDVQWCDFVSYDPRLSKKNLFIFRLERDEEEVNFLLEKIEKALEYKRKIMIQLGL